MFCSQADLYSLGIIFVGRGSDSRDWSQADSWLLLGTRGGSGGSIVRKGQKSGCVWHIRLGGHVLDWV
jgi:hypothetical protein